MGNLVDLLARLLSMTGVSGRTFLVSDGKDVSTSDLLRAIAKAMKKRARLFPVPRAMLGLAFAVVGKRGYTERLLGNLQVDISPLRALGWNPPVSFQAGIEATTESSRAIGEAR